MLYVRQHREAKEEEAFLLITSVWKSLVPEESALQRKEEKRQKGPFYGTTKPLDSDRAKTRGTYDIASDGVPIHIYHPRGATRENPSQESTAQRVKKNHQEPPSNARNDSVKHGRPRK